MEKGRSGRSSHCGKESLVSLWWLVVLGSVFTPLSCSDLCGKSSRICLRINPPLGATYPGPLEETAEPSSEGGVPGCSFGRLLRETPMHLLGGLALSRRIRLCLVFLDLSRTM